MYFRFFFLFCIFSVVAPQNVRAEDEIIANGPRSTLNLNGAWQILPIQGLKFVYPPPATGWKQTTVPEYASPAISSINGAYTPPMKDIVNEASDGFKQTDKTAAWYRRDFTLPATFAIGKRAILHFNGLAFRSETWVNGTKIGESVQGLVPVEYDVTPLLKTGQTNSIIIGLTGREGIFDLTSKSFIAPNSGVQAGIWGDVQLQWIPEVSVSDAFIKTLVGAKRIEVETTFVNNGKTPRTVTPSVTIFDSNGKPQTTLQSQAIVLAAGQQRTVNFQKNWVAPHLWSPQSAALYDARVDLKTESTLVDSYSQRFGFREFEIRGRDFFLNGNRVVLLRNSYLTDMAASKEAGRSQLRGDTGRPYNTIRLHLGFNNEHIIDAADEFGVMIHPELAWYHTTNKFPVEKSAVWLPNTLDYTRRFIKLHRNHPSITIWNLTNETFWDKREPDMLKIGEQVLATVKSLDPTRPQEGDGETSWDGRLPIINIHYPEGTAGLLREKYPNSSFLVPNDYYWLSKEGNNTSWRASFKWDRPLILGEYMASIGNPDETFSYLGEVMYDFEKWRNQDFTGLDSQKNEFVKSLKIATDIYRLQGVAGLNPWAGNRQDIMPAVAVRPLEFHPNFFSGRSGTRKVVVFNDSGFGYNSMSLQCRLAVNGKTVWEKIIASPVETGSSGTFDIPFDCPIVSSKTPATFSVRLCFQRGSTRTQLSRYEETIYILPIERVTTNEFNNVVLLDTKGTTATALGQIGLQLTAKTTLTATDLTDATTLVVGAGTDAQPFRSLISAFVRRGGRMLLLNQNAGVPLLPEIAQPDEHHITTRGWKRDSTNPILTNVEEAQLSYWQPDNIISEQTLQKPSTGKYRTIMDASGRYGLSWTPLLETSVGNGLVLQSQLNLVDRVEQEPLAGPLLLQLLRYCRDYKSASSPPLRLLVGSNDALKQVLETCAIVTSNGLNGSGPVLLDASYTPSANEIKQLKTFVDAGGKIWLHGFNSTNIGSIAELFPFKPQMVKYDPTIQSAARRSNDALIAGISSQEFYWTRIDLGARNDYFGEGQPTAKLGAGEVLTLPTLDAGEKLIEPGLLVKVPSGKGLLLFDTLLWENALGAETVKVSRLITTLSRNLGADIKVITAKTYSYVQADLSRQANRGFYDEVAGDGKGGWTDQGVNDMRYFLINHTGMLKGGGMEVGVSEFPSLAYFADRPFRLIDPKKNGERSVVALRGQDHGLMLPSEAKGVTFGRKADKLWFLQTACWTSGNQNEEVGRYIIHYDDSTQSVFPVRYGLEIGDWWNPKPFPNAKVGWTGNNEMHSPVGLYVSEWNNPEPTKTITSIDLIGNQSPTQIVLVGISGGIETNSDVPFKPVADWKLGEARAGAIANAAGGGNLLFGTPAPVAVNGGLGFSKGQYLRSETKTMTGVGIGGPFNLEIALTPSAKPDGYYGGLFQAANFGQSGLRVFINQQMQIAVEIFVGDGKNRGLKSKTSLVAGQTSNVEVKFDGTHGYLFINKKLEDSLETPPPAPYVGEISIGRASGKDYNYNGTISRIIVGVPGT